MPPRHRDHDRVVRCARLYITKDLDLDAAVERSGVSRGALWMVIKRLRAADAQANNKTSMGG